MKNYKAEAIVLRAIDVGNGDKLILLYTKEQGKIKAMAHGVAKPTSRKRGAVQLLSHSRFLITKGREMDTISQGELIEIFPFLWNSLPRLTQASYMAELTDAFTPDGEPNSRLFSMLLQALHALAEGDGELINRIFEMRLVALSGYLPILDSCANCQEPLSGRITFSPSLGGALCENCLSTDITAIPLTYGALENMRLFLIWPTEKLRRLKTDPATAGCIKQSLQGFIRYTLEKDLKTTAYANTHPTAF